MRILIIEDNKEISDNITQILKFKNSEFQITQTFDWEESIKTFLLWEFDIILLDLMLPKIDGITLAKRIRQTSDIPIIIMTAKLEDEDKILGLEIWADDYIVKPFKIEELYLRIIKVLKRCNITKVVKLWNIEINIQDKIVKKDWDIVALKQKEFQILKILLKTETISRFDLTSKIWWTWEIFEKDNKLDVYIHNIRKILSKDLIITIKWFWYSINKKYEN